jgi:serpin B
MGGPSRAADAPAAGRDLKPNVDIDVLRSQVRGNDTFALDLASKAPSGNLIFSPYSISAALAMAYAGARGRTAAQMARAMHFVLPPETLHPAFNSLDLGLAKLAQGGDGPDGFTLHVANALWGDQRLHIQPAFLDTLHRSYGAGLSPVDFGSPVTASDTINAWVAKQTEGRIPSILAPKDIDGDTVFVLTNAVYFLAKWEKPFSPSGTHDAPFTTLEGRAVTVPMMELTELLPYAEGRGWQAVRLPYRGGKVVCDVLLPARGQLPAFERELTVATLSSLLGRVQDEWVHLRLPRFQITSALDVTEALQALGMTDAFSRNAADFSGVFTDLFGRAYLSKALHKAFIKVDETSTEAAAATAVLGGGLGGGDPTPRTIDMIVDHPFLAVIHDMTTGQILFWGRVVDPSV